MTRGSKLWILAQCERFSMSSFHLYTTSASCLLPNISKHLCSSLSRIFTRNYLIHTPSRQKKTVANRRDKAPKIILLISSNRILNLPDASFQMRARLQGSTIHVERMCRSSCTRLRRFLHLQNIFDVVVVNSVQQSSFASVRPSYPP